MLVNLEWVKLRLLNIFNERKFYNFIVDDNILEVLL